jgi:hypothetical protein
VGLKRLGAKTNWLAVNRQSYSNSDFDFWSLVTSVRETVKQRGSWKGAAIQRGLELGSWGISTVRSRYQGTGGEDTAGWETAQRVLVVSSRVYKWSINPSLQSRTPSRVTLLSLDNIKKFGSYLPQKTLLLNCKNGNLLFKELLTV